MDHRAGQKIRSPEIFDMVYIQEANIQGVDQDEGLSKMLDSESSSEDEEKKKKKASCGYADLAILVGSPLDPKSLSSLSLLLFFLYIGAKIQVNLNLSGQTRIRFFHLQTDRQTDEGVHRGAMLLKTVVQIGVEYNSA